MITVIILEVPVAEVRNFSTSFVPFDYGRQFFQAVRTVKKELGALLVEQQFYAEARNFKRDLADLKDTLQYLRVLRRR